MHFSGTYSMPGPDWGQDGQKQSVLKELMDWWLQQLGVSVSEGPDAPQHPSEG